MPPALELIWGRTISSFRDAIRFARKIPRSRLPALAAVLVLWCSSASAQTNPPPLPADVTLNPDAGRGGLLIIPLQLADGEELPMIVDTGAPGTLLDQSVAPKLGKQLGTITIYSFLGKQEAGIYEAPKFYLGNVRLMGGSNVLTTDLKKLLSGYHSPARGILGMDCLRHYCLQLDFAAGKLRFLDTNHLNAGGLGRAFPLELAADIQHEGVPVIQHAGLLGGAGTNTVIDTGNNGDGMASGRAIRQHAAGSYSGGLVKRFKHFLAVEGLVKPGVGNLKCVWAGNTYTNLAVSRGPRDFPNWIGLSFLARHLVTLDFPQRTMYLKQTSIGPLGNAGTGSATTNSVPASVKTAP
jgi:Aspartyl protease